MRRLAVVPTITAHYPKVGARKTAAVRDALHRTRRVTDDPMTLLRTCGGADLASMATFGEARVSDRDDQVVSMP